MLQPTLEQGEAAARKMIEVLGLPIALNPGSVSGTTLTTEALTVHAELSDGTACDFRLGLADLHVTITTPDGTPLHPPQHLHSRNGIDVVGHDLSSIHKRIKSEQKWSVKRPTGQIARFSAEGGPAG